MSIMYSEGAGGADALPRMPVMALGCIFINGSKVVHWHAESPRSFADFQPRSLAGAGKEQNESLAAVRSEDMGLILVKS